MALKFGFYKCNICGNIVQVFIDGAGELVCCGQEMELLEPKALDEGSEKHVPVFESSGDGSIIVKIGSEPHPMLPEHHIQFIESISKDKKKLLVEFLDSGNAPQISTNIEVGKAFEYCNVHGLWEGHND